MNKNYELFKQYCLKTFLFLIDNFSFELVNIKEKVYGCYITYKNNTTAVRISYEPREGGIFVLLIRLIDGKVPKYPIFIHPKTVINSYYLDDIVALRKSSIPVKYDLGNLFNLNRQELQKILLKYAKDIQEYTSDILKGDFKIFHKLERIVKKRAKELEQQN